MLMRFRKVTGPGVSTHAPVTTGVFATRSGRSTGIGVASTSSASFSGAVAAGCAGSTGASSAPLRCGWASDVVTGASNNISGAAVFSAALLGMSAGGSLDAVCGELLSWLAGAVCGRSASKRLGLGVLDTRARRRSRSCESSRRCRTGLDEVRRESPWPSCSHMLTVSVVVLYTATGEFSLPDPVTGCDLPIDCHEFVRTLFSGEVGACATVCTGRGSFVWLSFSCRGLRESSVGLSGIVSGSWLSASRWRISSSMVLRGMYGVDAIIDASLSSKVRSQSADRSFRGVLLCDNGLSSIDRRGYR